MKIWDKSFYEISKKFPKVKINRLLVDAAAALMVSAPKKLDVLVATNLHADILSDLASALLGSLGLGATANLSLNKNIPSMFEPIHGAAFDIIGKNMANPIGALWSVALMLNDLGEKRSADIIHQLINIYAEEGGPFTPDLGGKAGTSDVVKIFLQNLKRINTKK